MWGSHCRQNLIRVPLSSTQTTSVQHIGFTQGPHLFSTQNPSVSHQKPLGSTAKIPHFQPPQFQTENPQFHTPLSSTLQPRSSTQPSVPHRLYGLFEFCEFLDDAFVVWKRGGLGVELRAFWCETEGYFQLRGFLCGTEGFWYETEVFFVLNWLILGVEKVRTLCGTDVMNRGVFVELRSTLKFGQKRFFS